MYMVLSTLTAISPVDGRYRNKAENLAAYFSEYALIKYRVRVEIEYPEDLSGVYGGGRFTSEGDRERDKPRCESGGVLY